MCANKAHQLQGIKGKPNTEKLIKYVEGNMIPHCPITRQDKTSQSLRHFRPTLGSIEVKTTRNLTQHHGNQRTELLRKKHRNAKLANSIMAIITIIFVMNMLWDIHFGTAELLWKRRFCIIYWK